MKNHSYHISVEVNATPTEVFNSINNVSKWWIKNFNGGSTSLNDEFSVRVPDRHYSKHKLVEIVPDKKVVWLVTESKLDWLEINKEEWTNTKMIFEIIPKGEKTMIDFTHVGLVPEQECYSRCSQGWEAIIMQRLYCLITEGGDKAF
jgi:hypothetical protein